ncbi:hypothetical protein [Paraburkholderia tuberum]|uniref:Uncharacterized protein n=1 Tax=Paraburkholderia tuberum TaxID=157910 RepID=A0A1H1JS50_9BURK|nr:hypothetical protein [Paraburkholderia tuberum]SDR52742.1 hypothetical protein SAMN05445850_5535 [Paraburkholderia tuberum]
MNEKTTLVTAEQLGLIVENFSGAIAALVDALDEKGLLTRQEASDALNERALRMRIDQGIPQKDLWLLEHMATGLVANKRP